MSDYNLREDEGLDSSDSSIEEIHLGRSARRTPESPSLSNSPPVRTRYHRLDLQKGIVSYSRSKSASGESLESEARQFRAVKKILQNNYSTNLLVDETGPKTKRRPAQNTHSHNQRSTSAGSHGASQPYSTIRNNTDMEAKVSESFVQAILQRRDPQSVDIPNSPKRTAWTRDASSGTDLVLVDEANLDPASSSSGDNGDATVINPATTVSRAVATTSKKHFSLKEKLFDLYLSILFPLDFLLFNILCILQTVPALTYYIYFFQRNFSLPNSSGMPTVWACTMGALTSAIVGSSLTPVPTNIVTRALCVALIVWEFVVCLSALTAGLGLYLRPQPDLHGTIWCAVCCVSCLSCGCYFIWLGKTVVRMTRPRGGPFPVEDEKATRVEENLESPEGAMASMNSTDSALDRMYSPTPGSASTSPEEAAAAATPCCSLSCVAVVLVKILLALLLTVFYLVPIGFGVNQQLTSAEMTTYSAPGVRLLVPSHTPSSSSSSSSSQSVLSFLPRHRTFRMHLHCQGDSNSSSLRPTLLIEADANLTGFAYRSLQIHLSSPDFGGWRVCLYDRAGYGWSAMSPLGSNRPHVTAYRLKSLLKQAEELKNASKLILIGHGDGFPMVQVFAALYPDLVAGVVNLDGYPNIWRLAKRSGRDILDITDATCGTLNMLRALESVGVGRALLAYYWSSYSKAWLGIPVEGSSLLDSRHFAPSSELPKLASLFNNGLYYASIFNDLCLRPDSSTQTTDRLTLLAAASSTSEGSLQKGTAKGPNGYDHTVRFPPLSPGIPALLILAGQSLQGHYGPFYWQQALQYNASLTSRGNGSHAFSSQSLIRMLICENCEHYFPLDSEHSSWAATAINTFFSQFY